jgi:hypothetical protein
VVVGLRFVPGFASGFNLCVRLCRAAVAGCGGEAGRSSEAWGFGLSARVWFEGGIGEGRVCSFEVEGYYGMGGG